MDKKQEKPFDYLFRFVLIGDKESGKTTFTNQLLFEKFNKNYKPTIGIEFGTTYTKVRNTTQMIKTTIWDIAGERGFIDHIDNYFNNITASLLFVDVSKPNAYKDLEFWHSIHKEKTKDKNIPCIIIATHIDDFRNIHLPTSSLISFAFDHECTLYEVDNSNTSEIHNIFHMILDYLLNLLETNGDMYYYTQPINVTKTNFFNYCNIL
jgi:small GTP-binding protein